MSLLSDTDIKKLLGRELIIEPFKEDNLTPIGYNFTVGDLVYSLQRGVLEQNTDGTYTVGARDTVLVLTTESLWVSKRLGGTFHSKVGFVSRGFSHISTTLDPEWMGPLLIAMTNNTDGELTLLKQGESFVTLVLHRLRSAATKPHLNPPGRLDILWDVMKPARKVEQALDEKQRVAYEKFSELFRNDASAQHYLWKKINEAQPGLVETIRKAARKQLLAFGGYLSWVVLHILLITAFIVAPWFLFVKLKVFNITYTGQIAGAQVGAVALLLISMISRRRG